MKSRLKVLYNSALAVLLLCSIAVPERAFASQPDDPQARIEALDNMKFAELLYSVDPGATSELIQKFQNKEATTRLLNGKFSPASGCTVEALRNKEVLCITIPAEKLFGPNSTDLLPQAADLLTPIKRYLREPDMFRVVVATYTDNTGDATYQQTLTNERADAVFEWFENSGVDTRYLFPKSFGSDSPIRPNTSVEDRAANRRVEIYLVPGEKMVAQAKKGRIAF